MIRVQLTPDQQDTAQAGYVDLSEQQIRSASGKLSASKRSVRSGGPRLSCTCGKCVTCRRRATKQRQRAKATA